MQVDQVAQLLISMGNLDDENKRLRAKAAGMNQSPTPFTIPAWCGDAGWGPAGELVGSRPLMSAMCAKLEDAWHAVNPFPNTDLTDLCATVPSQLWKGKSLREE
jgi:hypothetical protein